MKTISPTKLSAVALLLPALCGCMQTQMTSSAQLKPEAPQTIQQTSPELKMADHKAWINRLIATPPVKVAQQVSESPGNRFTVPVPTAQDYTSDGKHYSLQLDQQLQVAWLLSTSGASGQQENRHGPWRLDNPDVSHLLTSLRPPESQPSMQSGTR